MIGSRVTTPVGILCLSYVLWKTFGFLLNIDCLILAVLFDTADLVSFFTIAVFANLLSFYNNRTAFYDFSFAYQVAYNHLSLI